MTQQQQLDVQRHNAQYPPVTVWVCQHNHDRFLIIDDVVYLFGASFKYHNNDDEDNPDYMPKKDAECLKIKKIMFIFAK